MLTRFAPSPTGELHLGHAYSAVLAHHAVLIPSFDMQLCEDLHLMFGHMVMKALCGAAVRESA